MTYLADQLVTDFSAHDAPCCGTEERQPERAGSHTCPHCTWVNWCTFDQGHSGMCHCDQGHYWNGNH